MRSPRTPAEKRRHAAEESDATDAGATWFKCYPDATLIEAWWHAVGLYGLSGRDHQLFAFYCAFRAARERRDEYQAEEAQP